MANLIAPSDIIHVAEPATLSGAIPRSSAFSLLSGRGVTGCSQSIMMVSVAAAVVGIALAIFSGNGQALIGFSLSLVVSILGVFVAESAFEGERMLGAIEQLQKQNSILKNQTEKMSVAVSSIKGENSRLLQNNSFLEQKTKELQQENASLDCVVKNVKNTYQNLNAAKKSLKDQGCHLATRVLDLGHYISGLREVHDVLLTTNHSFVCNIKDLSHFIMTLQEMEGRCKEIMVFLESEAVEDFAKVSEQLGLLKIISEQMICFIKEDRSKQIEVIENLMTRLDEVERRCAQVVDVQHVFEENLNHVQSIHAEITQSCYLLDQQRTEIIHLLELLEAAKVQINEQRRSLQEKENSFLVMQDEALQKISTPLFALERELREKDLEIERLNNRMASLMRISASGALVEYRL